MPCPSAVKSSTCVSTYISLEAEGPRTRRVPEIDDKAEDDDRECDEVQPVHPVVLHNPHKVSAPLATAGKQVATHKEEQPE